MKNKFKLFGTIALIVVVGISMTACPGDPPFIPDGSETPFTISGSITASAQSINATFFASEVEDPSASMRSARSAAPQEIALEGLLEDDGITFRLRGSYNTVTKLYSLSAAASFMRFSISGDLNVSTNNSVAIVQIRGSGGTWTSIEVNLSATSSAPTIPEIDDSGEIEDELDNGIPEAMWGIWWGKESYERSKGDIIQSGQYYYVIDAFTIVEYVDRHGVWNNEGYTCFYEGADFDDVSGVVSGRVVFDYTDHAKIDEYDQTYGSWWVNCIADYSVTTQGISQGGSQDIKNRILAVLDDANQGWQLWSDPSWTTFMNEWAGRSQAAGFTGARWTSLFAQPGSQYFYQQYKKDAFRINSDGTLQMGNYYESSGSNTYFSTVAATVESFNDLRWATNLFTRDRSTAQAVPPTSQIVTGSLQNGLTIPGELTAVMHNSFEGKNNVLQVLSGFHWSVLEFDLAQHGGKSVTFNVSMDVWLRNTAKVAWQINQTAYMEQEAFPLVAGKMDDVYNAGQWHSITASNVTYTVGSDKKLYLSTMQILITQGDINAIPSLIENEIYIANVNITAVASGTPPAPPTNITGNLGNYEFGGVYEGGVEVGKNYSQAVWALHGANLGTAQADDSVLTIEVTYPISNLFLVWGAEVNDWYSAFEIISDGEVAANGVTYSGNTLTVNLKDVFSNFALFKTATFANLMIVDYLAVNINGLGMTSANLTSATYVPPPEPVMHHLGTEYSWTDANDSTRGWILSDEVRAKIADGSIKYFLIGLNANTIADAGGLGGINIIFNRSGAGGYSSDEQAFPWNWNSVTETGGWISYADLTGTYGAHVQDGVLYLRYDITTHPGYEAFKAAVVSAEFAQLGMYVHEAWENGATWHNVSLAVLVEDE